MFVIFIWIVFLQTSRNLHFQMAQSFRNIALRHFTPGDILVVCYNTPAHNVDVPRDIPSRKLVVSSDHYTNQNLQKDSYDIAHSVQDLRYLILEELIKIGAWSLLSFNANNDFQETENRHNLKQPQFSVLGQFCRFKCRHDQDVPICLMSVAGDILM